MSPRLSRSGERGGAAARPLLLLAALTGAILAIRLAAAASLHLTEDEAYYRLWSFSPALGFYDHPPMIAWWIWLGRHVAGDTALGARLLPSFACALETFLVFDMTRLAGGDREACRRAAVWFNAMLLVAAGGFLAVPDAPAALFWAAALWCSLRARRFASAGWWAAAGLAAGLAVLSKYSALFLAPGVLLWLGWDREGRAELRRPGPWLAALLAVGVFSLNIAWNAGHHWVTFVKQFGRVTPGRFEPRYLLEFAGAQVVLINPLIAIFAARRLAERPTAGERIRIAPFVATSAPFVAYLVIHSLHDRVQAHWPAPLYPAIAIVAAAGAERIVGPGLWVWLRRATPPLAAGACACLLVLVALGPMGAPWPDPVQPLRDWPGFAARLEGMRGRLGAAWIGTTSYGLAAELSDEKVLAAPIVQISERTRYQGFAVPRRPDLGRPGLLVDLPRRIDPERLAACFAEVRPLGSAVRAEPGTAGTSYALYLVGRPRADLLGRGC